MVATLALLRAVMLVASPMEAAKEGTEVIAGQIVKVFKGETDIGLEEEVFTPASPNEV